MSESFRTSLGGRRNRLHRQPVLRESLVVEQVQRDLIAERVHGSDRDAKE